MKTATTITIERDEGELEITVTADVTPSKYEDEADEVNGEIKATHQGEPITLTGDEEEIAIDALMEKAGEETADPWSDDEPDYDLYDD